MTKKRKRRLNVQHLLIVLLILLCILTAIMGGGYLLYKVIFGGSKPIVADVYDPSLPLKMRVDISTDKYLLSRLTPEGNYIVYANREDEKIYPASLTKLMTLKVATDYITDYDEMMRVHYLDLEGLLENDASVLGLQVNDEISLLNILYGLILPSGSDCANMIDRYFALNDLDLLTLMNQTAQELGMKSTHFSNTTGLYDENNYTTLSDLNLLGVSLMENQTARTILETYYREDDGFIFRSTARNYETRFTEGSSKILGGKTGFIPESGYNYFAIIKDAQGQISLLFLSDCKSQSEDERNPHLQDALKILNYYFD